MHCPKIDNVFTVPFTETLVVMRILGLLLLFIGLSQPLGRLTSIGIVEQAGHWSVASPLPLVFSGGLYEHFGVKVELTVKDTKGELHSKTLSRGDFQKIGGPFLRRSPYAIALSYSAELPPAVVRSVLRRGFCEKGALTRAFFEGDVAEVEMLFNATGVNGPMSWKIYLTC